MRLYSQFADDVKLCKRATIGALLGLLALVFTAWGYETLYGKGDLPMASYLSRWYLSLGAFFIAAGVISAFAIHLMRERKPKAQKGLGKSLD